MQEVFEFLKDCKTYFIATTEGDKPHVRPFGSVNLFEGKLYIQSKKGKAVVDQIAKNPQVELCGINGQEWIRVSGVLVEDDRVEAKQAMLDEYPNLKARTSATDESTMLYYLKDVQASICGFGSAPRVIEL